MAQAKYKHKPPARIRYEESHPTVSFRLTKAEHKLLKQRLEDIGMSFAEFVKESLGILQPRLHDIETIREEAWNEGFKNAYEKYWVWYLCNCCRKPIDISPNSDAHKDILRYMKEKGWGHRSCHEG